MKYALIFCSDVDLPRAVSPSELSPLFRTRLRMALWALFDRRARAALRTGRYQVLEVRESGRARA